MKKETKTPKAPKETKAPKEIKYTEITDEDWDKLEARFATYDNKDTFWENLKFEVSYFFGNIRSSFYSIKHGFKNLYEWRAIVWRNRWYDHAFLFELQRKQLNYMRENWHKSYSATSYNQQEILDELCNVLDKIETLEDDYTKYGTGPKSYIKHQDEMNMLYQKFGRLLYYTKTTTVNWEETKDGKSETKYQTSTLSNFERLWD